MTKSRKVSSTTERPTRPTYCRQHQVPFSFRHSRGSHPRVVPGRCGQRPLEDSLTRGVGPEDLHRLFVDPVLAQTFLRFDHLEEMSAPKVTKCESDFPCLCCGYPSPFHSHQNSLRVHYSLYFHRHCPSASQSAPRQMNFSNPTNQCEWDRVCSPVSSNQGSRSSLKSSSECVMVSFRKSISVRKCPCSKLRSLWESWRL